jgi:hypothetical protein
VESSCEFGIEPSGSMKFWAITNIIREGVMIICNHRVDRRVNKCSETN